MVGAINSLVIYVPSTEVASKWKMHHMKGSQSIYVKAKSLLEARPLAPLSSGSFVSINKQTNKQKKS